MKIANSILCALFIGLTLIAIGCTRNFTFEVPSNYQTNSSNKIPSSAALFLSSEYCNYIYKTTANGETWNFILGPTLCDYSKTIIQNTFSKSLVVMEKDNIDIGKIDLVVTPRVVDTSVYFRPGIPAKAISLVVVEWSIKDRNGEIIYMTTNEGNGLEANVFGSHTTELQVSVQKALNALFNKSYKEFITSSELRQFAKMNE